MIPPEKQQEQRDPDFLLPRENPLGLRGYDQIVKLTYPDEASAGGCRISAAPLPCRKKLAFSCRWDDNNPAHLRMHGLMCRYGFRGTFYLNDLGLIPPTVYNFLQSLIRAFRSSGWHYENKKTADMAMPVSLCFFSGGKAREWLLFFHLFFFPELTNPESESIF